MNGPATSGADHLAIRRTVDGQAIAGALFIAALIPPVILALLLALQHHAHLIPYSPMWAWGSLAIALVLAVQILLSMRQRSTTGLLGMLTVCLLLVAPASVLVYLTVTGHTANPRVAAVQVVLYAVAAVALLLGSLRSAAVE